MSKEKTEDLGSLFDTANGSLIGSVCPESVLKMPTAEQIAEEGVRAIQEQMANLYKNRDHIADAGKMVEVEKKCGTCKWYESIGLKVLKDGFCNYPLPPLPISVPYSWTIEREFIEPHYEDCPVWEGEE